MHASMHARRCRWAYACFQEELKQDALEFIKGNLLALESIDRGRGKEELRDELEPRILEDVYSNTALKNLDVH
jgi:hypothetical protein